MPRNTETIEGPGIAVEVDYSQSWPAPRGRVGTLYAAKIVRLLHAYSMPTDEVQRVLSGVRCSRGTIMAVEMFMTHGQRAGAKLGLLVRVEL